MSARTQSARTQITIAVGGVLTGGLVLTRVPPEVLAPLLGAATLPVLGSAVAYASSARVRAYVADAADELDRLLNAPRPRRRLAAPQDDPRSLLEGLLAQQMAAPAPQGQTARLVRQEPAQPAYARVDAPPAPEYVALPPGPRIVISYHPELRGRWASFEGASGLADAPRLAGDLDTAAATLAAELGVTQVRVAAASGHERGPSLALVVTGAPLTPGQEATLREWGLWWHPYTSGRVEGALVMLASPQRAAATRQMTVAAPVEAAPVEPDQGLVFQDPVVGEPEDDRAAADPLAEYDATEPELPLVEFATRLGQRESLPPPVARSPIRGRATQGPRRPDPMVPMARLVGSGAIPGIEITTAYNRAGEWIYRPVKHGMIAVSTGKGKSNSLDLILGQLRALGDAVDIWYGTAKPFVMIDPTDRLDRRPLLSGLPGDQLAMDEEAILGWIWSATTHMNQLYKQMQANPGWFPRPTVLIFDELKNYLTTMKQHERKATVGKREVLIHKLVAGCVSDWLTKARECGGSIIFTSQDGYCGSVELTRGEMLNLGYRQVHPTLDQNSMKNVLPEGAPEVFNPGEHDWFFAGGGRPVELGTVPRVSVEMFAAWGLLADNEPDEPAPDQGLEIQDPVVADAPALDDATLLRWVIGRSRAGEAVTVERAAAEFGLTVEAMRAQMVSNGLLEG